MNWRVPYFFHLIPINIPINNWIVKRYKKFVTSTLIVAIFITQVFSFPVASALDLIPDFIDGGVGDPIYDLVTIVVDKDLDKNNTKYAGLVDGFPEYLGNDSIKIGTRIYRYAEDIRDSNSLTDVKIIFYDKNEDSVPGLANALENLYINGDGTRNNRLSGVVLIGDIPLPVVNKNGNRFVSLYPYTDFYDKAYVFNPEVLSFERNAASTFPQPEAWHGVIKGSDAELAEFFDKNHLYYEGVSEYAKFDKRMFFGDLIHEELMMNADIYKSYVKFLESFEDLAYMRYNKHWANDLMGAMLEDTFEGGQIPINMDFEPNEDMAPPADSEYASHEDAQFSPELFEANLQAGDSMSQLPDIHAKQIIDKYAAPYYTVFPKFIAKVNDFADQTGRYKATEMDNVPKLISMKDEYVKTYLRLVNDAVEKEVNSIIGIIEQPMPLIAESSMTGNFNGGLLGEPKFALSEIGMLAGDTAKIKYNYTSDAYYINGRRDDFIETPKHCSVFLGSTERDYFDDELNYNPKRVDADGKAEVYNSEYSIMTRALRTDNSLTAQQLRTLGLNTRVLWANEALALTNNQSSNGAVIEDDFELGIPAYIQSTHELYKEGDTAEEIKQKNPFIKESGYNKGDSLVITKINNILIAYNYTVDQAIKNSYDITKKIIETYNDDNLNSNEKDEILDYFLFSRGLSGNSDLNPLLTDNISIERGLGRIKIEYILNNTKKTSYMTFTVHDDEDAYKTSASGAKTANNGPELFVNLTGDPVVGPTNFSSSDGAIFTMYDIEKIGRDESMNCNANSSSLNSDRCLYPIATYPVFDPAGSIALSIGKKSAEGENELMFRENIERDGELDDIPNSSNQSDYDDHTFIHQYPDGYTFEQIDEVIWNSCYEGYYYLKGDNFYKTLIDGLKSYTNDDPENVPDEKWFDKDSLGIEDKMKGNNIVLSDNSAASVLGLPKVTLQTFADRYALWDGVDNDNDGIRDFEWRDTDEDGVYDEKFFDYDEVVYDSTDSYYNGISAEKFKEISRKMLSHKTTYKIPKGLSPDSGYELILNIKIDLVKNISSMVIHNEPTEETIMEQMKNMTTMDLPIDNPRYVAFQAQSKPLPQYPDSDPINNDIDVDAIMADLDFSEYYVPGEMVKVPYPNIFDTESISQYKAELAGVAAKLAVLPGAYEIFGDGADEDDYELVDIFQEIYLKRLLPVVTSEVDTPPDGFDLEKGDEAKIVDSVAWLEKNIDEKHVYVLDYYLSDNKNAFIGDWSNFPSAFGDKVGFGYEAAYLVLDGEANYFDMNFNKDLPEELNAQFNPIVAMEKYANSPGDEGVVLSDNIPVKGADDDKDKDGLEFVDLTQFIKEVQEFIAYFTTVPNFEDACSYADSSSKELDDLKNGADTSTAVPAGLPVAAISLSTDRILVNANGVEVIKVTVYGRDSNGSKVGPWGNGELITLTIDQNENDPVFVLNDLSEKVLIGGKAEYILVVTEKTGNVTVSASSNSGYISNSITLLATGAKIELNSSTYFEPDGIDELLDDIAADKASNDGLGSNNGDGGGDGASITTDGGDNDNGGDEGLENGNTDGDGGSDLVGDEKIDGEGSGEDAGINVDTEEGIVRGDSSDNSGTSSSVQKDIQDVLTSIDGDDGTEGEGGDGNDGGEGSDGEEVRDKNGNIIILKSKLVEEEEEHEGIIRGEDEEVEWEQYYLDLDYYQKFLDDLYLETSSSRWIAEIASDQMSSISPSNENPFVDARTNPESRYTLIPQDEFLADGKSSMMVEASVFDGNGKLEQDSVHEVKFSIVESDYPNMVTFKNGDTSLTKKGVAPIYLRSGTKAGRFVIQAEVLDGIYPVQTKELYVIPGEPTSIEIIPETSLLVANNQSKTSVTVKIRDKFGNVANNAFANIALFTDSGLYVDPKVDTNSQIIGTQIGTIDGMAQFDMFAKDEVGSPKLIVLLMDYELEEKFLEAGDDWEEIAFAKNPEYIGNSKTFDLVNSVKLGLTLDKESIKANGEDILKIKTELKSNEKIVDNYNGPINFTLLTKGLGSFTKTPPEKMVGGVLHQENVKIKSSKATGTVEVLVEVPGFVSDTIEFKTTPGAPKFIELTASEETLTTNDLDEVVLQARLLDEYGNLADTTNNKIVKFSATDLTADMITFKEAQSSVASGGIASNRIKAKNISGEVNIMATSPGIEGGKVSLKITKHITASIAEDFAPRALYMSVLGGAFGAPMSEGNLAQKFINSDGQVQAVSATTASIKDSKRLISLDSYGKVEVLSATVTNEIVPATDSFPYQKVVFTDSISGAQLATSFVISKGNSPVIFTEEEVGEDDSSGIYVKKGEGADESFEFLVEGDDVLIKKNNDTKVKIDKFGRISVSDEKFELKVPNKFTPVQFSDFGFVVYGDGGIIAEIIFKGDGAKNVNVLNYDTAIQSFLPGVYLQLDTNDSRYMTSKAPSRYASDEALGVFLNDSDSDIDPLQAPRFSYSSLESASEELGLGFEGSNKHMLLFAAGNSVGESNRLYAAESGIIYGDPTVRLKVDGIVGMVSSLTGYAKTVGQQVLASDKPIEEMIEFDYNGDGREDILIIYEDGLVRLLENENSNKKFNDRGFVMNIYGGVLSATRIDVNDDGYDDLVVGTQDSCREGEECITLITNDNGNLKRETLNLDVEGKIYNMKSGDMNNDSCEDLVVADSAANIRIFYNKKTTFGCDGLEENYGGESHNHEYGFEINSEKELRDTLFVYYDGIKPPYEGDKMKNFEDSDTQDYVNFILETEIPPNPAESEGEEKKAEYADLAAEFQSSVLDNENIADLTAPPQTYKKQFDFRHLPKDIRFGTSSMKRAIDVNGGNLAAGDQITYTITLENSLSGGFKVMVSDLMPENMTLVEDSLKCLNGCSEDPYFEDTGMSLRPKVIHTTVPGGGKRILSYTMTVDKMPEMNFELGNNFADYPIQDNYLDIFVRKAINTEGSLNYLYSEGVGADGYTIYKKHDVPLQDTEDPASSAFDDAFGDIIPGKDNLLDAIDYGDPTVLNQLGGSMAADADSDGCTDAWSSFNKKYEEVAGAIAGGIEDATSALRCGGAGCSPIPYNKALLVPDLPDPGMSVVSLWPPTKFVGFGENMFVATPSYFRLYMSPTLSLGLGTAICPGPGGGASPCFAFAVPVGALGLCGALEGAMNAAVSAVSNVVTDTDLGLTSVVSSGDEATSTDAINENFGISDPNSPFALSGSINVKVPGFPSVITNWIDNQTDEIYNKLLDLPDFYFIYPDMGGLFSQFSDSFENFGKDKDGNMKIQSVNDFATAINSIPLVQIEGREVLVKIPALSQKEIVKWQRQAEQWVKHHENELNRLINYVCIDKKIAGTQYVDDESQQRICDKLTVDMTDLIQSIRSLMEKVDMIKKLPRDVLNWRNLEAKYATQIVCYLDALINYSGGYLKKQQKTIKSWMKAIEDAIRTFRDWKLILDLMIDYKTSCDQCKNDRFSKLGLLMQLFAAIPEPPIIPLPKWPDIVFDASQIKAGLKIVWPDLIFRPEPIKLPNLPYVTFPDVIPNVSISVPGFEIPDWLNDFPSLSLPNLPDLPPLPLPDLPDLPRPPKIPALPKVVAKLIANIKPIIKILCLLKNGYMPVAENQLATEIETLTQSNVSMVIPIIAKLGVQIPGIEYSYVEQIKITVKMNMGIDTEVIYNVAKTGADFMNLKVEWIISKLNNLLAFPLQQYIDNAIKLAEEKAQEGISSGLNKVLDSVEENTGLETSLMLADENPLFDDIENNMAEINEVLEDYISDIELVNKDYPETFYLTATQNYINPDDPILNRSIGDVEHGIIQQDIPDDPSLDRMVALRDSLIGYTKDLNNSNDLLNSIDDYDEFTRILVDNDDSIRPIAALSPPLENTNEIKEVAGEFFGPAEKEALLVAADLIGSEGSANDSDESPSLVPAGWFIGKDGQNENILGYTKELGSVIHFFSDVDDDGDADIVYSMGGDVFVKENHEITKSKEKGKIIVSLSKSSVSDYLDDGAPSVQGITSPYAGSKQVEITWAKPSYEISGYEVILRKSIYDDLDDYAEIYLVDADTSTLSIDIENGNYYINVFALDLDGKRSLQSESYIIAPQICADDDFPFPVISGSNLDVSIFKPVQIDASGSFDATGEIIEYYIETLSNLSENVTTILNPLWSDDNTLLDEDGDGVKNNDKSNPFFNLGEFEKSGDVKSHKMTLHISDESYNESTQDFLVNVFAPEINLDATFSRLSVATGNLVPPISKIPFVLLRSRYIYRVLDGELVLVPRVDKVETDNAETEGKYAGKYLTDNLGEFEVSGFSIDDMILIENSAGEIVAEIHPETGNIGALKPGYKYHVYPALPPDSPTRIEITDPNSIVVGTVYLVSDSNIDVTMYEGMNFGVDNTSSLKGVHVSDINDGDNLFFKGYSANNPTYPGGASLTLNDSPIAIFDTAGNIILTNKSVTLDLKKNNHNIDPLVIDINYKGNLAAEVYISPAIKNAQIVGPNDVPFSTPRPPSAAAYYGSVDSGKLFGDTNAELNALLEDLYSKGIIEGEKTEDGLDFNPNELVERAEFVKVLLKMLCIIPRDAAYLPYSSAEANGGFTDIKHSDPLDWYYPYIKEAALRDLVNGYLGEADSFTGLTPFKPEGTITRAESTKIILEALEMQGVINMGEVPAAIPWYGNYMKIGQDLSPYMQPGKLIKNNFIITADEAANPDKEMTRAELVVMTTRVLDIFNCFELDANGNGMSDFCEEKYNISDPYADPDNDELINVSECYYGTDPLDQDTDGGGIFDGPEVDIGANPLDDRDDSEVPEFEEIDYEIKEGESGIFAVPADCNTCPCVSTFIHRADIVPGDIFFAVIMTLDEEYIFSKSNEVVIESVTP